MLRAAAPVGIIGSRDGPPQEVFGRVQDVAVDDNQRTYVLDSRFYEVRIFERDGTFLQAIGRPGKGPGEFLNPISLTVDGYGRLYVGESIGVIHVFGRGGQRMRYERRFRIPVEPLDMCFIGDSLYVHGLRLGDNRLIHVLDPNDNVTRSFGVVYRSGDPLVDYKLSRGHIACLPSEGMIVYAPDGLIPEIQGYSTSGELRWVTAIRGYEPIHFDRVARGTRVTVPLSGFHRLQSLTTLATGYIVAQIAFVSREAWQAREEFSELDTFVISAASGEGTAVPEARSEVLAVASSLAVFAESDPFPRLILASLGLEE